MKKEMKKEMDNLTRDVLAAEAAGFGPWYGRYIAAFGHTGPPEPKKIERKIAVCANCGKEFFQQERWPKKYCSPECRELVRHRQQEASKEKRLAKMAVCAASPE